MQGTTFNKALIAGAGPAATTILLTLDTKFGWGMGPEFWGAVLTLSFLGLGWVVPNKPA